MKLLAGPFVVAVVLLGLGGISKVARPRALMAALLALRLPHSAGVVRAVGGLEVAVAVGALVSGHRLFAFLVAAAYVVFAVFVATLLRTSPGASSCGCVGAAEAPPTVLHVVADLVAAGVALAVAVVDGPSVAEVVGEQPMFGLPFLALAATCVYLLVLAESTLPRALHPVGDAGAAR